MESTLTGVELILGEDNIGVESRRRNCWVHGYGSHPVTDKSNLLFLPSREQTWGHENFTPGRKIEKCLHNSYTGVL